MGPIWSSARGFIRRCLTRPLQDYQRLDAVDTRGEAMDPSSQNDASTGKPAVYADKNTAAERSGDPRQHHAAHGDKAADFLDLTSVPITVTAADNKRILGKLDLVILPILLWVYFLQYLDKATLAYASVFGLIDDTNLRGEDYSWLGSIVYIAQMLMQPLVAFLLVKFPIGKFTGVAVFGWGAILCFMAVAHDFSGLMATRFFLGAFEASVAPAFVAITQMWWRRAEQTNRIAAWYSMNGVVNMVGSLLTYGLGHIHSSLKPYQIIFLFCGLLTVASASIIFVFLPDSPIEAKFLNSDDKLIAVERLRMNQMGVMSREWRWDHVMESFLDIKTWFWFSLIFSISIPSGGISTFGPLIVQSFGFESFTTILFNIPFGAVQLVAIIGGAYLASRIKKKGPVIVLLTIPAIAGCIILMRTDHANGNKGVLLAGYYLISFYPGITPLIYSWSSQNTAGDTKRKCTTGFLFVGQSAGNIIGPHFYTTAEAPQYTRGLVSNLSLYAAIVVLVILTTIYLMGLNRKHSKIRSSLGKAADVIDTSMSRIIDQDPDTMGVVEPIDEVGKLSGGKGRPRIGEKAFSDETDLKNEDFIFVY